MCVCIHEPAGGPDFLEKSTDVALVVTYPSTFPDHQLHVGDPFFVSLVSRSPCGSTKCTPTALG